MTWTQFMDMHSGGRKKLDWSYVYIEASEDEARRVFYNRFSRSPDRVSCTCCGSDYSLTEAETFEQASGYERGCAYEGRSYVERADDRNSYKTYRTVAEYLTDADVLVVRAANIKAAERSGEVPEQGYVWKD